MLTIIMSCYFPEGEIGLARSNYAVDAIESLAKNLHTNEPTQLVLAHDGPYNNFLNKIESISRFYFDRVYTSILSDNAGIGASLNNALILTEPDVWMYTTDDWVLTRPLEIDSAISLINNLDYDYVRIGPLHPNIRCNIRFNQNQGWWLDLNCEDGGFVFATRPFIMSKHAYDYVGPFQEYVNSYDCEKEYNARVCEHNLSCAALINDGSEWQHIGVVEVGHLTPSGRVARVQTH